MEATLKILRYNPEVSEEASLAELPRHAPSPPTASWTRCTR